MTEYRMNDELCPIVDMHFMKDGTQLVCLSENNRVNLFYTKMIDLELMSENARKGY